MKQIIRVDINKHFTLFSCRFCFQLHTIEYIIIFGNSFRKSNCARLQESHPLFVAIFAEEKMYIIFLPFNCEINNERNDSLHFRNHIYIC